MKIYDGKERKKAKRELYLLVRCCLRWCNWLEIKQQPLQLLLDHATKRAAQQTRSQSKFGCFINRHTQAFTLTGALIVFLTFIVKDEIKEHVKEVADSLESTESLFLTRSDIGVLQSDLHQLSERFEIPGMVPPEFKSNLNRSLALEVLTIAKHTEQSLKLEYSTISRVVRKLPSSDYDLRLALTNLQMRLEQVESAVEDATAEYQNSSKDFNNAVSIAIVAEGKAHSLSAELSTFSDKVLGRFALIKESNEHLYAHVKSISFMLYAVGWLLAVGGKFFGVKTLEHGE